VTGRLVVVFERLIVDIAQFVDQLMWICAWCRPVDPVFPVTFSGRKSPARVVEVATFDQVVLEQQLDLAHKDEGAAIGTTSAKSDRAFSLANWLLSMDEG
jgi:hypothetical protein